MQNYESFYIDGAWKCARSEERQDLVNPATGTRYGVVALGSEADAQDAIAAAKRAFPSYSQSSVSERLVLLRRLIGVYERRYDEMAEVISREIGSPITLAREAHAAFGLGHLRTTVDLLESYEFNETINNTIVTREAFGVCALITPWNWPMNQIGCKVAPALAAGCTVVLKPSEVAPLSGLMFAEFIHEAGYPAGVFNLVNGAAPVGQELARHQDVDLISFTGSTNAGIDVARLAAPTVKRVHQELGGKSPNIILEGADFRRAVEHGVRLCFSNTGQSCNAPTRMIVPISRKRQAEAIAREIAEQLCIGEPSDVATEMGPLANLRQFERVQEMIAAGIADGARLITGGQGRPEGHEHGFYVQPTVFSDVENSMRIAREEIFGPVLSILTYETLEEAVDIANDTVYGLCAYVSAADVESATDVARKIRAGMVHINGQSADYAAAFGGYKRSGNGREWGRHGFEEFLEIKSIFGTLATTR